MTLRQLPAVRQTPVTATERIFEHLYQAVISLELPPGTKVSEAEIARQLDVSRQPVRDVFYRLSKLGFLHIRPQRATLVSRISPQSVQRAIFVRTALEVECLRAACAARRDGLITELRLLIEQQTRSMDQPIEFHALDEDFHSQLCTLAGHPDIWNLIQEQKAHLDRIRYMTLSPDRRRLVVKEHHDILKCIENKDLVKAETKLRKHLSGALKVLEQVIEQFPQYFEESRS